MTLAIIPKIAGVILVVIIFLPWFLATASDFMSKVLSNIPFYLGTG